MVYWVLNFSWVLLGSGMKTTLKHCDIFESLFGYIKASFNMKSESVCVWNLKVSESVYNRNLLNMYLSGISWLAKGCHSALDTHYRGERTKKHIAIIMWNYWDTFYNSAMCLYLLNNFILCLLIKPVILLSLADFFKIKVLI